MPYDMTQNNCYAVYTLANYDYGLLRLPDLNFWLTAGVTGQQGMLTLSRRLIPPLVNPWVHDFMLVFFFGGGGG